jgi:hypothetical protein
VLAVGCTVALTGVAAPGLAAASAETGQLSTADAADTEAAQRTAFVDANNILRWTGTAITDRLVVGSDLPRTVFLEETENGVVAGAGCSRVSSTKVRCAPLEGSSALTMVVVDLAGGHDEVRVQASTVTHVSGGSGRDRYFGASSSTGTSVVFDGGADVDSADYQFSSSGVLVDLDNAFDDGRLGVDRDNIMPTVENLSGSDHDDSLRGSSAANFIVGGLGADALRGGDGNDEIWAQEVDREGSEADKADLSCGKGIDTIILDTVDPGTAECESIRRVS